MKTRRFIGPAGAATVHFQLLLDDLNVRNVKVGLRLQHRREYFGRWRPLRKREVFVRTWWDDLFEMCSSVISELWLTTARRLKHFHKSRSFRSFEEMFSPLLSLQQLQNTIALLSNDRVVQREMWSPPPRVSVDSFIPHLHVVVQLATSCWCKFKSLKRVSSSVSVDQEVIRDWGVFKVARIHVSASLEWSIWTKTKRLWDVTPAHALTTQHVTPCVKGWVVSTTYSTGPKASSLRWPGRLRTDCQQVSATERASEQTC